MSFESIDPSIQRDMSGQSADAAKLLAAVHSPETASKVIVNRGPTVDISLATLMSLEHTRQLISITDMGLDGPFSSQLHDNIDFDLMQKGYDALQARGLEPEVVIAPAGRPFNFWKGLFERLRLWQEPHAVFANNRLLESSYPGTLFLDTDIMREWGKLAVSGPSGWSVGVLPGIKESPLTADYYGDSEYDDDGYVFPTNLALEALLREVPQFIGDNDAQLVRHPYAETYLTMQALRVISDQPLLDQVDPDQAAYTWLQGDLVDASDSRPIAPMGSWSQEQGSVHVITSSKSGQGQLTDNRLRPTIYG
jgi:hypothetical protein